MIFNDIRKKCIVPKQNMICELLTFNENEKLEFNFQLVENERLTTFTLHNEQNSSLLFLKTL